MLVSEDLLDEAWGWSRLLLFTGVTRSDCSKYLEDYYRRNARELVPAAAAATGSSSIAALAETVSNHLPLTLST